jgi:hypothetical protein
MLLSVPSDLVNPGTRRCLVVRPANVFAETDVKILPLEHGLRRNHEWLLYSGKQNAGAVVVALDTFNPAGRQIGELATRRRSAVRVRPENM